MRQHKALGPAGLAGLLCVIARRVLGLHATQQPPQTALKPEAWGRYELLEDFGKDRPHLFLLLEK